MLWAGAGLVEESLEQVVPSLPAQQVRTRCRMHCFDVGFLTVTGSGGRGGGGWFGGGGGGGFGGGGGGGGRRLRAVASAVTGEH